MCADIILHGEDAFLSRKCTLALVDHVNQESIFHHHRLHFQVSTFSIPFVFFTIAPSYSPPSKSRDFEPTTEPKQSMYIET